MIDAMWLNGLGAGARRTRRSWLRRSSSPLTGLPGGTARHDRSGSANYGLPATAPAYSIQDTSGDIEQFLRGMTVLGKTRQGIKHGIDVLLRPVGGRVLTTSEEQALSHRYSVVMDQLYDTYVRHVFPDLREQPGRRVLLSRLIGTEGPEAIFLLRYLQDALDSGGGDVVEMGVAQGATSALLANELLDDPDRRLWLYDSFMGLSTPTVEDELINDMDNLGSMLAYSGSMSFPEGLVRERVEATGFQADRLQVVAGYLAPESAVPDQVAFAYLDFDLYEPILTGLRLLHPSTRPGSILMVDDYRFFSSGPELAVQHFLAGREGDYELLEPPAGTGAFCALRRTDSPV
jgi:O-methyltransferase